MKNRVLIALLLLTGIISATSVSAFEKPQGEKLISFTMDPEIWEVYNKDTQQSKTLVWYRTALRAEGKIYDESYAVTIYNQTEKSLDHMRNRNDEPGRRYCVQFESIDLAMKTNTVYDSRFWRTHCLRKNAPAAQIIHRTFKGENHIYHIQKSWTGEVDEVTLNKWIDRLNDAYVCDINREDAACPVAPLAKSQTSTDNTVTSSSLATNE